MCGDIGPRHEYTDLPAFSAAVRASPYVLTEGAQRTRTRRNLRSVDSVRFFLSVLSASSLGVSPRCVAPLDEVVQRDFARPQN